jgi:1-deoxy-D-xylulose 5-phosphate reductoisomerase
MKPKNVVLLGTTGSIGVSTPMVAAALLADAVLAILDEGMHH